MRSTIATLLVSILAALPVRATTINVPSEQPTIQAGIDIAGTGDEVVVADGVYTGPGNRDVDFQGKAITVRSASGDPLLCTIDCEGTESDPHRGFFFHSGEDSASVLAGLTITNGYAPGEPTDRYGGGIKCVDTSSPTIRACIISNCAATWGGGVQLENASPTLVDCVFESDSAEYGAGINCRDELSSPVLVNCIFSSNEAFRGGGMYCFNGASASLMDCNFIGNIAVGTNQHNGGGMWCKDVNLLNLRGCDFIDNTSSSIAGISFWRSSAELIDCLFSGNSAENSNGAVFAQDCELVLDSCTFTRNSAPYTMAVSSVASFSTIANCTFYGNYGGSYVIRCSFDSTVVIENTIVAFSGSGFPVYCNYDGGAALTCCNLFNNEGGDWVGCIADQYGINGNISVDPQFCDTLADDFHIHVDSPCAPENNDCGVLIGSLGKGCGYLCGDADASGQVDIDDAVFLVAYIFSGGPSPDPLLAGDADCSTTVDIDDVVYLINYIFSGGHEPCDTDGDGMQDC